MNYQRVLRLIIQSVLFLNVINKSMENQPKVLVAVPFHKEKNYCLKPLMKRIQELTYPKKEVVMRWDLEKYGGENNVKIQREFFRVLALQTKADYLYFMGADTIPPADVLDRLVQTAEANDFKIIGGVYWGRSNAENGRPDCAVAWINELSQPEQAKIFSTMNTIVNVDGMGMDAVLIHRDVLEKISWLSWPQNDDDYPFYDKAKELGYKIYIDTNIQCKHYFSANGYAYLAQAFGK
jgi:hypothetical protein